MIEKLAGAVTALAGCPASLSQDAVGFRIEPVGERHPELRRQFQFDAHVPELIDPVACVHGRYWNRCTPAAFDFLAAALNR